MNQILVPGAPGYNGPCPNMNLPPHAPRPILRICQGAIRRKYGPPIRTLPRPEHQTTHLVCDRCRNIFWHTIYIEPTWGHRTNSSRVRQVIRDQHRPVCIDCDREQKRIHPQPFNGCKCHNELARWQCMHCTRYAILNARDEWQWKDARSRYFRRDENGRLHIDRRNPYRQDRCMCDRKPIMALTQGTQTLQCIRCEKYEVRATTGGPPTIKRSQRVKNRDIRLENRPELRALLSDKGQGRTARVNKHGFAA